MRKSAASVDKGKKRNASSLSSSNAFKIKQTKNTNRKQDGQVEVPCLHEQIEKRKKAGESERARKQASK